MQPQKDVKSLRLVASWLTLTSRRQMLEPAPHVTAVGGLVSIVLGIPIVRWTIQDVAHDQAAAMVVADGAYVLVSLFAVQTEHAQKITRSVVAKYAARRVQIAVKERGNIAVRQKRHVVEMGVARKRMACVASQQKQKKTCVVLRRSYSWKRVILRRQIKRNVHIWKH